MRTVTVAEAMQGFEELIEAAQRQPVVIQRQKRDVAVVMSMDEYERLVNLNVAEFQRFSDRVGAKAKEAGMTEEVLQGLLGHLLEHVPAALAEEQFLPLVSGPGVRVERIVSTGQSSPPGAWFDQDEDEFVLLLAGEAVLRIEGMESPLRLTPGAWVNLPAHSRHRVEWTQAEPPTVWLAVFTPPA